MIEKDPNSDLSNNFQKNPEAPQKLTTWKNEPDIRLLKHDFLTSKNANTPHLTKIKNWRDLMNIEGSAKPVKVKGRSAVQPKLIRRQAEWRYAALTEPFLSSSKLFKISPVSWEDLDSARQNELILNWQFRTKLNQVKFVDEYVRTTVDEGTCIIRLGWIRETRMISKEVPVFNYMIAQLPEEMEQIQMGMGLKTSNPNEFKNLPLNIQESANYTEEQGVPVIAVDSGKTTTVQEEQILFNQPTLEFVNPENIYIDPSCQGDMNKARFIIMSFETSKAELKKDTRYKNLDSVNFDAAGVLAEPDHVTTTPQSFQFDDSLRRRIVAYEYWGLWDINGDGVLVPMVATWVGDTLIRLEKNPFPDEKAPFVLVPYMPIKRSLYGETDAELLEDNQKILGAVSRGMIDILARSANGQKGIQKGLLDPVNRKRYDNGQDYEVNPVQNGGNGIIEHTFPEFPQSAMTMLELQNMEAEALTGVKAFSGGMSGNAYGDVAAGIRGMLDAAAKREMAILRRLAQGVKEIGYKLIMMNQEFLSEEEVVRVTNEQFVTIRREELGGHFDLEVDISTAEVDNSKAQDLGFMLQTIGPDMDIGQRNLILSQIAELKRMPTLAHSLRNYKPTPDPLEEALKQAEIEKIQLEVQKLAKEIEVMDSQIALNHAKANETETKADLNNLDFVEQESGTHHERELQKQGAQARANQDLEVTKALVKPKKDNERGGSVEAAVGYNKLTEAEKEPNFGGRGYAQAPKMLGAREFDGQGRVNPSQNINSQYFDNKQDPALNPALNLGR